VSCIKVVRAKRDRRRVPRFSDSDQQLQRRVASWSGNCQAAERCCQRGPEGHWSSHLWSLPQVAETHSTVQVLY